MRRSLAFFTLLLITTAASAQSVKEKYDKTADLAGYRTWAWKSGPRPDGKETQERYQGWERHLVAQVEAELKAKNLEVKPEAEAALLLTRTLEVKERTAETSSRYPGSGARGAGSGGSHFRELTFVIDMIDAKSGKSVWNGKVMTEVDALDDIGQRAADSAKKLLKKFPPEKK